MQIPLVVLVLGVLIPVSGLIAWAGDRIGHQVGKRRHTLLGLRPRHTAMLFTIGSGIGISLVSFALLWVSSEGFRMVLGEGVRLLTINKTLRVENARLAIESKQQEAQTKAAREEAKLALADRDAARTVRDRAFDASRLAQANLTKAQANLQSAEQAVKQAQQAFAQTQQRLGATEADLKATQAGLVTARAQYQKAQTRVAQAEAAKGRAEKDATIARNAARIAQSKQSEIEANAERAIRETGTLLTERNQRLEAQRVAFDQEKEKQRIELDKLQGDVAALETRRQELTQLLGASMSRTTALRRGQITYRIGEEVDRVAISSDQSIWKIESALQSFFRRATKKAEERGATPTADGKTRAVALAPITVPVRATASSGTGTTGNGDNGIASNAVLPSEEDAIRSLAQSIRTSDEQVAVVLIAAANAVGKEPVLVEIKTYRNPIVLQPGVKLGETTLTDNTMTRQDVAEAIYDFLRSDIRKSLLNAGMIPTETGDSDEEGNNIVSLTGSEWLKIMDDVKRANFRARVIVKTARALRAADEVSLQFEIKSLPAPMDDTISRTLPGNVRP